jgi:hypothetical protein
MQLEPFLLSSELLLVRTRRRCVGCRCEKAGTVLGMKRGAREQGGDDGCTIEEKVKREIGGESIVSFRF